MEDDAGRIWTFHGSDYVVKESQEECVKGENAIFKPPSPKMTSMSIYSSVHHVWPRATGEQGVHKYTFLIDWK